MWGIIPAAGRGSRIQPLAFSKELLPVGSRTDGDAERPLAVSEHLVERMLLAGVDKLCFVISPGKSDILQYYGGSLGGAEICYVVQERPAGLCDALFRALPFIAETERVCVGLPDTIWFPRDGLARLHERELEFLLFPVDQPQLFDAVLFDEAGRVQQIQVKSEAPRSRWVWGAFQLSGRLLRELFALWREPGRQDEYWGTLVNAYLDRGGHAWASPSGESYVDVGTLHGFRAASHLLEERAAERAPEAAAAHGKPPRERSATGLREAGARWQMGSRVG
jgi:dTDP-glucose pyrophosphorylase